LDKTEIEGLGLEVGGVCKKTEKNTRKPRKRVGIMRKDIRGLGRRGSN